VGYISQNDVVLSGSRGGISVVVHKKGISGHWESAPETSHSNRKQG
jgi:hypothetical protein